MARPQVEITGARELRRTMRQAGVDMKEMKETNSSVSRIVVQAAAARAPKVSGRLAAGLKALASQTAARVRAGSKAVPYAGPIHWGWPKRNIKPNPFIADAAQATKTTWLGEYQKRIDQILNKIKGDE